MSTDQQTEQALFSSGTGQEILVHVPDRSEQRVLSRILERGGYRVLEPSSPREVLVSLRKGPPALLILHAALSGEGARDLVRTSSLSEIPILLVGPQPPSGTLFHWVQNYLQRPFSPRLVLKQVEEMLSQSHKPPSSGAFNSASFTPPPLSHLNPRSIRLREKMLELLWPPLTHRLEQQESLLRRDSMREVVIQTLREILDDDTLEGLVRSFRDAHPGVEVLYGELAALPLPEIFQMLTMQRQTGVFVVEDGPKRVEVFFLRGDIAQALGYHLGGVFRLGRYLVAQGRINAKDLALFLRSRSPNSRVPVGEQLVQLGYLDREDLQRACVAQSSDLIYDLLSWPRGRFSFSLLQANGPELARITPLNLNVEHLIMEGMRRLDEWRLMISQYPEETIFVKTEKGQRGLRGMIGQPEQLILDLVDGQRSIRQIMDDGVYSPFVTLKALITLLQADFLESN